MSNILLSLILIVLGVITFEVHSVKTDGISPPETTETAEYKAWKEKIDEHNKEMEDKGVETIPMIITYPGCQ